MELRRLHSGEPRHVAGYRLLGGLGDGGQGSVFLARDSSGTRVAVKMLHTRLLGNARAERRFLRESAIAAGVAGFCTARVLDSGVVEGRPYIVSEFIEGPSLHDQVAGGGALSGGELERLAVGTVTALTAIHGAGIVHRDFKPSNILMGPDGPRVIDFGIAKGMDASTTSSSVVGTPGFMAPEQIAGESVTAATDVFSWASTMGFAGTGEPLFGRDSIPAVMHRILNAEPDLDGVAEPLRSVLRACLAKEPGARPTADDVLMRLLGRHAATAPMPAVTGPVPASTAPMPAVGTAPLPPVSDPMVSDPWVSDPMVSDPMVSDPMVSGPPSERTRRLAIAGIGALLAAGLAIGLLWRGWAASGGDDTTPRASASATYGVELGLAFGPPEGADIAAMAIGHHRGTPVVAYADRKDNSINVWDARGGKRLGRLADPGEGPVLSLGLALVGGKQTVVWTGADGRLRRWEIGRPKQGAWHSGCASDAVMGLGTWRGHAVAVVGCPDGKVETVDLVTDDLVGDVQNVSAPVNAVAWHEGNGRPLIGTDDGVLGGGRRVVAEGRVSSLTTLGNDLAAVTSGTTTGLYDLSTGELVRSLATGGKAVGGTTAGGRRMIAAGSGGVSVWNADAGTRLGRLLGSDADVTSLAVGDGLLVAQTAGRLRAWSLTDGA
ncbi:protein kinase [Nonomuraea sp. PA05]|uniref:WD40 repeat domain-containing serine/threonine protein kinase n=1 Tax=Nonomuraea sp. PA05 TaxID=2604466 RepID=UPI0011D54A86|nr:serine/threonine-protein kinase [Nonomuraea sp. PA05]TYB62744.1 protein kinase [Nonomuraea sp. PA05]